MTRDRLGGWFTRARSAAGGTGSAFAGTLGLGLVLAGGGCALPGGSTTSNTADPKAPNAGLRALAGPDATNAERAWDGSPTDLNSLLDQATRDIEAIVRGDLASPSEDATIRTGPTRISDEDGIRDDNEGSVDAGLRDLALAGSDLDSTDGSVAAQEDDAPTEETETRAERISVLVSDLAWLLREEAAQAVDPARVYLALAALEAVHPGVLSEIRDDSSALSRVLSPAELETIRAAARVADGARDAAGDPGEMMRVLDDAARTLREHAGIRVTTIETCRRVSGFGRYQPLDRTALVAGRPHRMILYTELERFTHRPIHSTDNADDGDRWAVELTQEISLVLREGDPDPTWGIPAQRVIQSSRRRIRDLYLIQEITLPSTLSLGAYELRVRVRDTTSGAEDERSIPIRIVAAPIAQG